MARYSTTITSQATQLSGAPSGTTVNGYIGYWGASATAGFRLRRLHLSTRIAAGGVPTSQQVSIGVYRQTVAPAGTGLAAAVLGQAMEIWTPQTDPTVGMIATTATTIGTTGPTIGANPVSTPTFNTQSTVDMPYEFTEELICNLGTANGLAFVILGGTLPTNHLVVLTAEIEV
jgi:hypothetical protein